MRTNVGRIAALLSAVLLGACDLTVTPPGKSDQTTGTPEGVPITTFATPATGGCVTANPKTVLVDATHDGGVWWFPQGANGFDPALYHQGKALVSFLTAAGYAVTELPRGVQMSADSMMRYATVIRAGYYYDIAHPGYSAADLAAYAAYSACDRTLILFSEFLRDGRKDVLAEAFGIPLTGIVTDTVSTFTTHALTSGVSPFVFLAGSVLENESNPSIQVLGRLKDGKAAMGVLSMPNSKVFFIGDMNGVQFVPQPFVTNLVVWGFR